VYLDNNGVGSITVADIDAGSTDADGDALNISVNPSNFNCNNTGANTVTLTVDDGTVSTQCTTNVYVVDDIDPVLSGVPGSVTVECDSVPAAATPSASDNCDTSVAITFSESSSAGSCANSYTITRTWTAADDTGNTDVGTQTITVQDTTDPVLAGVPADVSVECNKVPVAALVTATDNCGGEVAPVVTYAEVRTDGNCANSYTLTRTWTATDACGNTDVDEQVITVQDTTDPVLAGVPADVSVECNKVPVAALVTATDNCGDNPVITYAQVRTDEVDSCPSNYTLTRTWTATDACGNASSESQVITVEDTIAPTLTSDVHDIFPYDAPITFNVITNDNCGDVDLVLSYNCHKVNKNGKVSSKLDSCDVVIAGNQIMVVDSGGVGTIITISATATDECGNSTSDDFVVNVLRPANEGVGNGVDENTPGHANNGGNDDPEFGPGKPGAKGGKKNR